MKEQGKTKEIISIVKRAFELRFGRIYEKDIALLESYYDGEKFEFVFFRNRFTNRHYRVDYCEQSGGYRIEETED